MVDIRLQPKNTPVKFPPQIRSLPRAMQELVIEAYRIDDKSSLITPDLAMWAISRVGSPGTELEFAL